MARQEPRIALRCGVAHSSGVDRAHASEEEEQAAEVTAHFSPQTRKNKKPGAWPGSLLRFAEDL
jgi:hypothetical protein